MKRDRKGQRGGDFLSYQSAGKWKEEMDEISAAGRKEGQRARAGMGGHGRLRRI